MVKDRIDLRKLNMEELAGVVSIYPWYGVARKELCRRMSELGEGAWTDERFADEALYIASRSIMADMAGKGKQSGYADADVSKLLERYLPDNGAPDRSEEEKKPERKIVIVGGDYFSQIQYEGVRRSEDNIFSSFAKKAREEGYKETPMEDITDFCTETLAGIYVEQEYYEQAVEIYSKLSLRYPEKSAYFASLIEKIKNR